MLIALDRQHWGKPAPDNHDLGASGNGIIEANWTPGMIDHAVGLLDVLGHGVLELPSTTPQSYDARHKAAKKAGLYVACHVNAAGKVPSGWEGYALVEYIDPKMAGFARWLATETGKALRRAPKTRRLTSTDRGWSCINGVSTRGVIFEPFFVEDSAIARDKATAGRVAKALAIAVRKVYGAS